MIHRLWRKFIFLTKLLNGLLMYRSKEKHELKYTYMSKTVAKDLSYINCRRIRKSNLTNSLLKSKLLNIYDKGNSTK